mmetsp:Transcript_105652/g.264532  ORF Transcript_105652/g.264532 Transcript_105652/m.264532 type:complete len:144 (+) Transcript_105652:629-1060(+)
MSTSKFIPEKLFSSIVMVSRARICQSPTALIFGLTDVIVRGSLKPQPQLPSGKPVAVFKNARHWEYAQSSQSWSSFRKLFQCCDAHKHASRSGTDSDALNNDAAGAGIRYEPNHGTSTIRETCRGTLTTGLDVGQCASKHKSK